MYTVRPSVIENGIDEIKKELLVLFRGQEILEKSIR